MTTRSRLAFLALVLAQAAHSVEEYVFRLYEVFSPARFVSGLLTDDLPVGFAIFNVAFVLFGLWCWAAVVQAGKSFARVLAWSWGVLEFGNGVGHSVLALERGGYFPGLATAPILIAVSVWLALEMTVFAAEETVEG